jgi:hypothetical protein
MPDGRVARFEVAEGTTPEQAQSQISAMVAQQPAAQPVSPVADASLVQQPPATQPQEIAPAVVATETQPDGFIDTVSADLAARNKAIQETMAAERAGEIGSIQGATQAFGQVAGGAIDVLGEGLAAAGRGAAAITPEFIKQPIIETANEAFKFIEESDIGSAAIDAIKGGVETYNEWAEENPNAAKTLGSAVNLGLVLSPVKPGGAAAPLEKAAADTVRNTLGTSAVANTSKGLRTSSAKKLLEESAPTIEGLKQAARGVYKEIDNLGITINPRSVNRLSNELSSVARREGFNRRIHPKVSAALDEFKSVRKRPQTLSELDVLRKVTNGAARSIDPDEARIGQILLGRIDDSLDNLKSANFTNPAKTDIGGKYRDARQLWRRAKKSELLEEAFEKAKNQASGFENGIRTQFRSILNNKKKLKGFTPEEIKSMQTVVRGGTAENLAKAIGKFGFNEGQASTMLMGSLGVAGGAAIAGAPGAVAVPLIGQVSKTLAQKLTRRNARGADLIVRAGNDGLDVVKSYLKAVPAKERSSQELTELLLRPNISLEVLKKQIPKLPKESKKLATDALFFTSFMKAQTEDDK